MYLRSDVKIVVLSKKNKNSRANPARRRKRTEQYYGQSDNKNTLFICKCNLYDA